MYYSTYDYHGKFGFELACCFFVYIACTENTHVRCICLRDTQWESLYSKGNKIPLDSSLYIFLMFLRNVCHIGLEGTASFFHLHKNTLAHTFAPHPESCWLLHFHPSCTSPFLLELVSQNPVDSTRTTVRREHGVVMGGALWYGSDTASVPRFANALFLGDEHSKDRHH